MVICWEGSERMQVIVEYIYVALSGFAYVLCQVPLPNEISVG